MSTINRVRTMSSSTTEAKVCVAELTAVDQQQNNLRAALSALIVAIGFIASLAVS